MVIREHFECGESAVTVICDESFLRSAKEAVLDCREAILRRIDDDPFFASTFDPLSPDGKDPVIDRMCRASIAAGVGPMAAVAGTVADYVVRRLMSEGSDLIIVDNGGDIALHSDREVSIGLHCSDPRMDGLGLLIPPVNGVLGICSSSGKIGPSVSLGEADLCTVISEDVPLADASATRLGNLVHDSDQGTLTEALEQVMAIDGVRAALIYDNGMLAVQGDVPEIIRVRPSPDLITKRIHLP